MPERSRDKHVTPQVMGSQLERVRFGARLRHAGAVSRLSLGDLAQRCDALALSMADLFATPQTTLVRHGDRLRISDLPKAAEVLDTLITPAGERHVTVLETTAAPGRSGRVAGARARLPWIVAPARPDPQGGER